MYFKKFNWVQRRYAVAVSAASMLFMISRSAVADFIPPPTLHSLMQEDQDVNIRIQVPVATTSTQAKEHTIIRTQNGVETVVVADVSLTAADADGVHASCRDFSFSATIDTVDFCALLPDACLRCDESSSDICIGADCDNCHSVGEYFFPDSIVGFCDEFPEYRLDCNNDGEGECCGTCDGYIFDFRDTCVPPGTAEYSLKNLSVVLDTKAIDVIDAHDEDCEAEPDTAFIEPASSGVDENGCHVATPGRTARLSPWQLARLMLVP